MIKINAQVLLCFVAILFSLNILAFDVRSQQEINSDNMSSHDLSGARIIGYLPGWKNPPDVNAIKNAGYTHIIVAFAVFSKNRPGEIVPVFDTISKDYIKSLNNLGIRTLISIGGASTSIANTTVNFHQALSLASNQEEFEQNFVKSVESLIDLYAFQGVDFDIENGLNGEGNFTNPKGDIAILANIINTLHANNASLLLTLTPQIANIAATSGFDAVWGNYASLIMQTHDAIDWVGIQVYNSGCAFGINLVCYDPNQTISPDAAVAFATDLLENWPDKDLNGRPTGFQPYISYLKPSQIVLGFPAANAEGISDGAPPVDLNTVKRAIQCLRTGEQGNDSCDTYIPPHTYQNIGGVFEWEITYDADSDFKFATELLACVINRNCKF